MIAYTYASSAVERSLEHLDRVLGRRDRLQPLLAVPVGPRRVHHAHDRLLDAEALLGDLGDHEVRVVAGGRGDEDVGALDAGLDQGVGLERRADRELPAGVLPALALARVEPLVRERVLRRAPRLRGRRRAPTWRRPTRRGRRRRSVRTSARRDLHSREIRRWARRSGAPARATSTARVLGAPGRSRSRGRSPCATTYLVMSPT